MSETTPEDHLIILRKLITGNKTLAISSSIRARVNGLRVQVNCSRASVKLHLSCTIADFLLPYRTPHIVTNIIPCIVLEGCSL